jgi:hypothetical protein
MSESVKILTALLATGDQRYRLSGMYIEFANAVAPVAIPSYGYGPTHCRPYYDGLGTSPTNDYLRLSLNSIEVLAATDSNYPDGNVLRVSAFTSGAVGVHGKTFSNAASSTVIGGAVVAMVDPNDPTSDKIFSRFYLPSNQQKAKEVSSQIGVLWLIPLP